MIIMMSRHWWYTKHLAGSFMKADFICQVYEVSFIY